MAELTLFEFIPDEVEETFEPPPGIRHAGKGILELALVAGRTEVTRAFAANPLRFLVPRRRVPSAWVYAGTYGGGLVAGDDIDVSLRVRRGARGVLATQASSKVFRCPAQVSCRHRLRASVEDGGLLVLRTDPLSCFSQARYEQSQSVHLHGNGCLVLVDWLTSGRRARGERWAMSHYRSRLDIFRDGELVLSDALLLDPADGPLESPFRLGRFHCLATMILIGEQLAGAAADLLGRVGAKPVQRRPELVDVASPLRQGAIVRVIGETTELVSRYLVQALAFLDEFLGEGPWVRKW